MAKCDMHLHSCFSKEYLIDSSEKGNSLWYQKLIKFTQALITINNKKHARRWTIYYKSGFSPEELYNKAMKKGMDFFCLTDHDTIDGWKSLIDKHPELKPKVITGVELTSKIPKKSFQIHINIYGLNEKEFKQIRKISGDIEKVFRYCKKHKLICSLNHWGDSPMKNRVINNGNVKITSQDLAYLWNLFDFVEVRNGFDYQNENESVECKAKKDGKFMLAGSDSHVGKVGITWTEVPNAKTKKDFLDQILNGKTKACGSHLTKKRLKEEIMIQSRTYSGLYYTDNIKYFDKKLGILNRGLLPGIFYFFIEKFFQIFILVFSGIVIRLTVKD